jgi:hypothetical protein
MAASISDYFMKLGGASSLVNTPKVTATRSSGGTTLTVDNCNWDQTTGKRFATFQVDTSGKVVDGTEIIWKGVVTGTTSIGSLSRVAGASDAGNAIGDYVMLLPASDWANQVVTGLLVQHNQDGTHGAVTATSVSAATVAGTTSVSDAGQTLQTYRADVLFDHVASGCVWSGDAYASTRNASMTAGVVYIGGKRVSVSAVTARAFTASKDTYIDVDNTGTITYTEVTNNAASPALSANNVRLGIIVTGASNIAAAGSVNQGQETMVLPIASSIPYAVTDSLGNLICPRDPNRKILGYRQQLTNATSASSTAAQIPALSCPVIVPTGRKIRITTYTGHAYNNSGTAQAGAVLGIWDGTVGSGTQLVQSNFSSAAQPAGQTGTSLTASAVVTPSTTSKTYNSSFATWTSGGGNAAAVGSSTSPLYIQVELV